MKKNIKEAIKFAGASVASFLVDYGMFSLLIKLTNKLVLSNIVARIISSLVNYTLNKKLVFKDDKSVLKSIFKYYTLAVCVLIVNTILLTIAVKVIGINEFIAKGMIEVIIFIGNYIIQRLFIFKKEEK